MNEIPESMRKIMDETPGDVIRLIDSRTKREYVLIPVEMYEDMQALIGEDEWEGVDVGKLIDEAMREEDLDDSHSDRCQEAKKPA